MASIRRNYKHIYNELILLPTCHIWQLQSVQLLIPGVQPVLAGYNRSPNLVGPKLSLQMTNGAKRDNSYECNVAFCHNIIFDIKVSWPGLVTIGHVTRVGIRATRLRTIVPKARAESSLNNDHQHQSQTYT